ncbi:MAG: carboxy-S-adenosyl-L-methionine synthase CmoA, partial [Cellvibrionales bacterium]|nr:carboxy-S-adenosyl-L-methionine synthase CmoA [Cellvibrionales bacterium]
GQYVSNLDQLYAKSREVVEKFQFDEHVAQVFSDMVKRSVPGYPLMLDALGVISESRIQSNSLIYDLGCSLGASTLAIAQNINAKHCKIIGIDNAPAMVEQCRSVIENTALDIEVTIDQQDILEVKFAPCQFICMNLTLQFIPEPRKDGLIQDMAKALQPGGALFLSEKIAHENPSTQKILTDLHHQFKKHQGYSALEIAQKREAIENYLTPDTLDVHYARLTRAGFTQIIPVFQCFNFISLLAIR